jgi:diacylglycerol O-acyltransferase / wax synthase
VIDRLSPIETVMWRVGHDPTLRMAVGNVMILDRPVAAATLAERLASAAAHEPRLHQLPDDPTRLRRRPAWVDDPTFDVANHLRTMTVPSPGTTRQFLDLVALIDSLPFDPDRSPWDVTLMDGLEGGRAALYLRAHHVFSDGIGSSSLIELLLDDTPRPPSAKATPVRTPPTEADGASSPSAGADGAPDAERRPGVVTIDLNRALRPLSAGVTASLNMEPLDFADALVRGVQRTLDVANSVSRQVLVSGGPLSSLPPARSMTSRFELISVPSARHTALGLGGSRNDLLVAAASAGLGRYYERLGAPCPELRLVTPTSLPRSGGAGGNWFSPTRATVPTGAEHPGPHFGVVSERLAQARGESAVGLTAVLAAGISRLPTRLLVASMHAQAASVDFAATTLPGLRSERHICGAVIERSYPLGPRLGCPVNITAFGNEDRLDVGVALDAAAITDPELLRECLLAAFGSYLPATGGKEPADAAPVAYAPAPPGGAPVAAADQ